MLDPWEAWAFDLSYERYFGDGEGYVSIAGFYKDLDTYIYDQTVLYDSQTFLTHATGILPAWRDTGSYR